MTKKFKFKMTFNMALFLIWVLIFLGIAIKSPAFLSSNYIINVMLKNIVEIAIISLPTILIIITGGIDLSVGNIMVLSATLGGITAANLGTTMGILVTLLTGVICGFLNGIIITKAKISAMVTTLASMYLYLGIARGVSHGTSIYSYNFANFMGNAVFVGIPIQIWIYIVFAIVFIILLGKMTLGRKLYSIGLNTNAAKYCGINNDKILILLYTLCGVICAFVSFIWLGRFSSLKFDAGTGLNMKVITVAVLGGTSINGGIGDMKGTVLATLIIATLNSGLTVMNIPIDMQTIVQGTVLILALIAYSIINDRARVKKIIKVEVNKNQ